MRMKARGKGRARRPARKPAVVAGPRHGPPLVRVPSPAPTGPAHRTAQTRKDTRQVGGHFKPEVAKTLRLIAAEQDKHVQEILAEALNMIFAKYGKPIRVEISSRRRKKAAVG
jgi:hypothetical protein